MARTWLSGRSSNGGPIDPLFQENENLDNVSFDLLVELIFYSGGVGRVCL